MLITITADITEELESRCSESGIEINQIANDMIKRGLNLDEDSIFEKRIQQAYENVEKDNQEWLSPDKFIKELKSW